MSVAKVAELLMANMGKRVRTVEKELQPHETLVSYSDNRKARENSAGSLKQTSRRW